MGFFSEEANDHYSSGGNAHILHFLWKNTYTATTDCGLKVKYTLSCNADKIDHAAFRSARMLEEQNQQRLIDDYQREILLPALRELRCSFRYLAAWNEHYYGNPCLCCVAPEGGQEYIWFDFNCFETNQKLKNLPMMPRNGCRVSFFSLELFRDEELFKEELIIKENYDMIKVRTVESPENLPSFRQWEESVVASMLHRHLELRKEFQNIQGNQNHDSRMISVNMRFAGNAVELSWNAKLQEHHVLRGFRKEDGFATTNLSDPASNGSAIVETRNPTGKAVLNLNEGKEYFFTFVLTQDEAVYEEQSFTQSLFQSAKRTGSNRFIVDSLRFSIRLPSRNEMQRIDRMIEKLSAPVIDPKKAKLNRAIEELTSFIEFDENISELETNLVARIKAKGYSEEKEQEKIDRLKGVAELIRINAEDEKGTAG
jgi:hypothetical protein